MYRLLRPLLFSLDPERAHTLGMAAARFAQATALSTVESMFSFADPVLHQTIWGLEFRNPVGLAAGFDKNARLVPFWERVGFGFAEVGSVTARPSTGNPRPRAFRLPEDRALINRMGLNNEGADRVAQRLPETAPRLMPLGINIAKTPSDDILGPAALEDFRHSFHQLAPRADYITLNISCPNTEDGTTFEEPEALDRLLTVIMAERRTLGSGVPVLIKLAPLDNAQVVYDSQLDEVVAVAVEQGVAGFIATNTASDRQHLRTDADRLAQIGRGGLSGRPLAPRATQLVRYLYRQTDGALPIIGVGGIDSAEAAYARLRAGASLVQLYTGLVYEGPGLVRTIKEGLVTLLRADGFGSLREVVGRDASADA